MIIGVALGNGVQRWFDELVGPLTTQIIASKSTGHIAGAARVQNTLVRPLRQLFACSTRSSTGTALSTRYMSGASSGASAGDRGGGGGCWGTRTAISPPSFAPPARPRRSPLQNRPASYQFGLRLRGSRPMAP